jgi:twitching motility protein PilT
MKVNDLLKLAVEKGSSDLHLTVASPPIMRIDGILIPQDNSPALTADDIVDIFGQVTKQSQKDAFTEDRELDFAYAVPGLARFRINAIQQRGSMSLAFRRIPFEIPTIDEMGLPEICKELALKHQGLILITGSSGSGKSTTLAAMINHLNDNAKRNILTIEDPIEFLFNNKKCIIRQRDIGDDTKSFDTALVHALRHDPDVIVIGEMRDFTTISTAIRAAETGHLVLGTLHTIDAAQSIDRIIDVFPPSQQRQIRLQLSQVLEAVLSQTLLPRKEGGRVAAFEILLVSNIIRKKIREGEISEIQGHMKSCICDGMQTLEQALAILVKEGIIDEEDALLKCADPKILTKILEGAGSIF